MNREEIIQALVNIQDYCVYGGGDFQEELEKLMHYLESQSPRSEREEVKKLIDCIHNFIGFFDTPLARLKLHGDDFDEVRKIGREILNKYNVDYRFGDQQIKEKNSTPTPIASKENKSITGPIVNKASGIAGKDVIAPKCVRDGVVTPVVDEEIVKELKWLYESNANDFLGTGSDSEYSDSLEEEWNSRFEKVINLLSSQPPSIVKELPVSMQKPCVRCDSISNDNLSLILSRLRNHPGKPLFNTDSSIVSDKINNDPDLPLNEALDLYTTIWASSHEKVFKRDMMHLINTYGKGSPSIVEQGEIKELKNFILEIKKLYGNQSGFVTHGCRRAIKILSTLSGKPINEKQIDELMDRMMVSAHDGGGYEGFDERMYTTSNVKCFGQDLIKQFLKLSGKQQETKP